MELYLLANDPDSIRAKFIVKEKEIPCRLIEVDADNPQADHEIDSDFSGKLTLRDRNFGSFVFNDSDLIIEYLDERFPYPPLMPTEPFNRARCRWLLKHYRERWFSLYAALEQGDKAARNKFSKELNIFSQWINGANWLFGKEISLADCSVFPFFLRLRQWNIPIPPRTNLDRYMNKFMTHTTVLMHFSHEVDLVKNTSAKASRLKT